jgi:hypothetical protein
LDFDNDGWADLYIGSSDYDGTHGLLWHQVSPARFETVSVTDGIDHRRSHGRAVADFDRDGDLDLVVGHSRARCSSGDQYPCYDTGQVRLFENQLGGNFVQIHLTAKGSNTAAIGARAWLTTGDVTQTQDVDGGHGQWGNQDDQVLHFGLGEACEGELTVRWPDAAGTTETVHVVAGYRFGLAQGGELEVVE